MRHFTLPIVSRWLTVVVLALLALSPTTAQAQTPTPPTLLFLDERDLRVNFNQLREQGNTLTVEVFNRASEAQTVEVYVPALASPTGGTDLRLARLLPKPVRFEIAPARVGVFSLSFGAGEAPDPGVYQGYIVATGSQGNVILRKFSLEVGAPGRPGTLAPAIKPEGRDAVTLNAVNYFPSLLSPSLPDLLLLIVGLAGLLAFTGLLRERSSILLTLGLVVVIVLAMLLPREWLTRAVQRVLVPPCTAVRPHSISEARCLDFFRKPSWVVATPVWVAPSTGPTEGEKVERVGSGQLVVKDGLLWVQDVPRAGKYEWKVDLRPDDDKQGEVAVTAQVADWWLWAALTLGLGLLLGRWVTGYFQTERGASLQRIRYQRLRESLPKQDQEFSEKYPSLAKGDLKAVRVTPLATAWLDEVGKLLDAAKTDASKTDAAKASLDSLESYLAAFRLLRDKLVQLHAQRQDMRSLIQDLVQLNLVSKSLPQHEEEIDVFEKIRTEFNEEFTYTSAAEALKDVEARRDRVAGYQDWLTALKQTLDVMTTYRQQADKIVPVIPTQAERRAKLREGLQDAAELAIKAASRAAVDQQNDAADKIGQDIEKLDRETNPKTPRVPRDGAMQGRQGERRFLGLPDLGQEGQGDAAVSRTSSAAELQRLYELSERQMNAIAGVIAVGSGLLALYFSNPTWGSSADYLKALLWGSTVSEGLKYVNVLLRRVWS